MKSSTPGAASGPPPAQRIHWRLVWGVVALQACLQMGWIIYNTYQPVLLQNFGFAALLPTFALLGGFLGLAIEPLSGAFSDRFGAGGRGRLLPITLAVTVAGLIFLATAGFLRQGPRGLSMALPVLMVLWVVAMQSASSPNLAQLNEAVSLRSLPQAVALLTVTQGLIGAFSGELALAAQRLGPTSTFMVGGLVLALGLAVLRAVPAGASATLRTGQGFGSTPGPTGSLLPADLIRGVLLLVLALAVGGQSQILLNLLPRLENLSSPEAVVWGKGSLLLLCSAIGAPLTARAVGRWGHLPSLAAGILLLAAALVVRILVPHEPGPLHLALLGVIHSLVLTSLTATSLASLPPGWSGLGAGLALGGAGLAGSLAQLRFGTAGPVPPEALLGLLAGTSAVALVICLLLARHRHHGMR